MPATYPVDKAIYGQLMEWLVDIDDPKDEHRHVNHLFGLHPGHTVSPVTTPELAEAAKVVLVHRGDGATGWSMGWKLKLCSNISVIPAVPPKFPSIWKGGCVSHKLSSVPFFSRLANKV